MPELLYSSPSQNPPPKQKGDCETSNTPIAQKRENNDWSKRTYLFPLRPIQRIVNIIGRLRNQNEVTGVFETMCSYCQLIELNQGKYCRPRSRSLLFFQIPSKIERRTCK